MSRFEIYESIVHELSKGLKNELIGRNMGDLLHYAKPHRYYPVGNIFPETISGEDNIMPSSCGFSTRIIGKKGAKIKIVLRGHYYIRRMPTLKEQREHLARVWHIPETEIDKKLAEKPLVTLPYCWLYLPFKKNIEIDYDQTIKEEDISQILVESWRKNSKGTTAFPWNETRSITSITEAEGRTWENDLDYEKWLNENFTELGPDPENDKTHTLIIESQWKDDILKVYAINRSTWPSKSKKSWYQTNQNIYAINFECPIPNGVKIEPSVSSITDTFDATAVVTIWGEGRNLQVRFDEKNILYAEPFGNLKSNRAKPLQTLGNADLSFETLSNDPIPSAEEAIRYLKGKFREYSDLEKQLKTDQAANSVKMMQSIIDRVSEGLELLRDPVMCEAFKLMNETFYRRYICDENINSWYGFQFVYILGKLPHIVKEEENLYDVIFVPTGGGKTETYFGFIITAMFYFRLKGINTGSVAIVKFPLRMLAIDQIQRIAPFIAIADMIRRDHPKLGEIGGDPDWLHEFSLGFMIGGSSSRSTPNRVHGFHALPLNNDNEIDEVEVREDKADLHQILMDSPNEVKLIFDCPVCRYNNHKNKHNCGEKYDTVSISYDENEVRARHQCEVCGTRFAIHWSDEECFRYLPTIIVSTQDRVAYGAFAPHMRALLGGPLYVCPLHGYSIYSNSCTPFNGKGGYGRLKRKCSYLRKNKKLKPSPSTPRDRALRFIIQDEMHLLKSELGALDSPFEKMISETINHYAHRKPQYIGMSATVQGVRKQILEIYGSDKRVWIFPGDPPSQNFAEKVLIDAFFEHTDDLHRLFLGCMPSIQDPSIVVSRSMDISTKLISLWEDSIKEGNGSLPINLGEYPNKQLEEALRLYRVNLGFMRAKIDLERTKQNLINITNVDRRKLAKVVGYTIPELSVEELTGDNTIGDIREAIHKIKGMVSPKPEEKLDVLLATNLVSHGIDLKEMNFMVFFGIPGSTSEYLQALSRVGRTFPGIILVIFHPRRSRDRGLWRTFHIYHRALRQQVETMPVDHRAPGLLDQTLITLLRNYWNLIAEPAISPESQALYKLNQIIAIKKGPNNDKILIEPAVDEILKWFEWSECNKDEMYMRIEEYLEALQRYHDTIGRMAYRIKMKQFWPPPYSHSELFKIIGNKSKEWMSTMTGIRGIQEGFSQSYTRFAKIYLESGGN